MQISEDLKYQFEKIRYTKWDKIRSIINNSTFYLFFIGLIILLSLQPFTPSPLKELFTYFRITFLFIILSYLINFVRNELRFHRYKNFLIFQISILIVFILFIFISTYFYLCWAKVQIGYTSYSILLRILLYFLPIGYLTVLYFILKGLSKTLSIAQNPQLTIGNPLKIIQKESKKEFYNTLEYEFEVNGNKYKKEGIISYSFLQDIINGKRKLKVIFNPNNINNNLIY